MCVRCEVGVVAMVVAVLWFRTQLVCEVVVTQGACACVCVCVRVCAIVCGGA